MPNYLPALLEPLVCHDVGTPLWVRKAMLALQAAYGSHPVELRLRPDGQFTVTVFGDTTELVLPLARVALRLIPVVRHAHPSFLRAHLDAADYLLDRS